jgi:autotransporter family porin
MRQSTVGPARRVLLLATALLVLTGCQAGPEAAGPLAPSVPGASSGGSPLPGATDPPTPGPTGTPTPSPTAAPKPGPAQAPARFTTRAPGARLPSGGQCATWVRARPKKENKRVNRPFNRTTGHRIDPKMFAGNDPRAARRLAPRIDGKFTGTTEEILRWAACKWGVDENIVKAQAAIESWWRQDTRGDFGTDASRCPPGHGLGADGEPGKCPESWGILQNRYPYEVSAFPGAIDSTAMSADLAYGIWRMCFEGYETWLNTVERGRAYRAGDAWGCVGRWFSGRWHTDASARYVARVRDYLDRRIWQSREFQQP